MKKVGVAILGLGVVGGGTYRILTEKKEFFKETQGLDITVENVLELNRERALSLGVPESVIASSIQEVVSNPNVDIVVEVIGGVKVAKEFVMQAILSGKSVVTSNKELVAKYWHELEAEAKSRNVGLYFEASCVGGVPIIRTLIDGMQGNRITSLSGIVNGTTNYILTKMESCGKDYDVALKEAQALGYAELNPTADVEGFDSTYKLSILSSIAFNKKIPIADISREGITGLKKEDLAYAAEFGYTVKLLAVAKDTEKGVEARVAPTLVPRSSPLVGVSDSFNAVFLSGDSVGDIMLYGRGAGALPTGSAIVSDVVFAAKHSGYYYAPFQNTETAAKTTKFVTDGQSKFFVRFSLKEDNGVLTKVTSAFSKSGVDLSAANLSEDGKNLFVLTESVAKSAIDKALLRACELTEIEKACCVLRVED